ncbi:Tat (twin-arginine translocation) pathway signal sequence [Cyclobacterium xiamenense]|uniref:Tat (Twin-arginine translocation) pathway signal sequence n=1 Tax=Cyclobacterium xiamenense TaxID=1297121 RepID=A0A1H6SZK9_9BACT|nr:prolyl oligopeptidase family serine peptidase [Cyclobacterium xiamenense]SEI73329.1 Tat (twin-arginine translocation) pathway signal sequence [Cyclobacterium xiamenense]
MENERRDFIKKAGLAGASLAAGFSLPSASNAEPTPASDSRYRAEQSIIGPYGPWLDRVMSRELPSLSFRNDSFTDLSEWKTLALSRTRERLGIPVLGERPRVTVHDSHTYDGLRIEEVSWQLPYGRPTKALVLKPENAEGRLPGILAFHDHGGNKYFGWRKITKTGKEQHPLMKSHQEHYYEGMAWANEVAKRGYVVMVSDAFTFASRRVMLEDVPENQRSGLNDSDPENPTSIEAYNQWAGAHEHVMAKSLFCGGTTWPGVFFAEDQMALDILASRPDVDESRLGCGGLSGGGLRTVMMAGLDARIRCAVCVGFMSTWTDFLLHKSFTHTWMTYVPRLPEELDFPEILGLRVPLPTLVLNDEQDQLYTLPEMKKADAILQRIYEKVGASDRYKASYYPGPHKFDQPMQQEAFAWWDKWLKN